jgi:hypothetical protein
VVVMVRAHGTRTGAWVVTARDREISAAGDDDLGRSRSG